MWVNIRELKIGCLVKIEGSQELISITHSMVDSKRCEKTCDRSSYFLILNAKKLIQYLINSCFFINKIDNSCKFCKKRES